MDPYSLDIPPSTPIVLDGLEHSEYEVSPYYWMTEQEIEASGMDALADGNDAGSRARKFDRIRTKIIHRRAKGRPVPRRLRTAFKQFKPIRPGETRNIPAKLKPHPLIRARGPAGFLQWFRLKHPFLFAKLERERPHLIAKAPPRLMGLGQDPGPAPDPVSNQAPAPRAWWQEMLTFAERSMTNKHDKEMAEIQIEAAKVGAAPLEVLAAAIPTAPAARIGLGVGAALAIGAGAFFLLGPGMKAFR